MKKWIGVVFALLVLLFAGIYLFIPSGLQIHAAVSIHAPANGILRQINQQRNWKQWWPGDTRDSILRLNSNEFRVVDLQFSGMTVGISSGQDTAYSQLQYAHEMPDTLNINWGAAINTSSNPLTRITRYRAARKMESAMQLVLDSMKRFYEVPSNLYGLDIRDEALFDSVVVFTETGSMLKPDNSTIYPMVDKLRAYIFAEGAHERNEPMMSYFRTPEGPYSIRVAIPVDKPLKGSGDITRKALPPRVRIFTADILGDQEAADAAMGRMNDYVKDHFLNAAGGPYFILKTDRRQEKDPARWITRIIYPVM